MKKIEFEVKNLNEAQAYAVEEFKVSIDKIKLELVKEKKGLLGIRSSQIYEASIDVNLALEGKKYLEDMISPLGIDIKMELRSNLEEKEIYYYITSNQNALLIGREGRTLLAFQSLLRTYLNSLTDDHLLITLDIGNYNANRKKQLEILATKTAKEVTYRRKDITLEPMNAFDRRIIHTKLSEWRDVVTESVGEGEDRAIVIKYKG